ncbi:cardiolipin synthase [Sesbania bispinosa]|nr:cardiolipin synthase [Sesbania bispinosa]
MAIFSGGPCYGPDQIMYLYKWCLDERVSSRRMFQCSVRVANYSINPSSMSTAISSNAGNSSHLMGA